MWLATRHGRGSRRRGSASGGPELRFRHRASDREAAGDAVDRLVEAADRLRFTFEGGTTSPETPVDQTE